MNPRHIGAVSPNTVVRSLQLPTFTEATGRNWFQLILLHSKMKLVHIWTLKKSPVYLSGGYETAVFPFANTYIWLDMDFPSSCLHLTNTPSFLQPSDFIHCNYELPALPVYPTLLKFYHSPPPVDLKYWHIPWMSCVTTLGILGSHLRSAARQPFSKINWKHPVSAWNFHVALK